MNGTTEMVTLNNTTTEVYRKGEGPTLVLIQGAGAAKGAWYPIIDRLADRIHCVTFDNRGTGKATDAPDDLMIRDLSEDAADLIRSLDEGPVHVTGVSLGGMTAMRLASEHPELVKSLVLHSTAADRDARSKDFTDFRQALLEHGLPVSVLRQMVALTAGGAHGMTGLPEDVNRTESFSKSNFDAHMHAARHHVMSAAELARITAPTLITVGSDDISTTPKNAAHLHRSIPGSKMVTVEDGGHGYYIEEPDLVATLTAGWVLTHA